MYGTLGTLEMGEFKVMAKARGREPVAFLRRKSSERDMGSRAPVVGPVEGFNPYQCNESGWPFPSMNSITTESCLYKKK